jgi:periplasmic protein TonB
MKLTLSVALILTLGSIQETFSYNIIQQDTIYLSNDVDLLPAPEKGLKELYKQFYRYFRYPADARRYGIEGTVNLSFIVDKNGDVSDITVIDGVGYGSETAVLDAFKQIKVKWVPGQKDSNAVNVRMTMPFKLKLA